MLTAEKGQAGRPATTPDSAPYLADEIHTGAYYLYLHGAGVGSSWFEGYAQGNVQPLVDLRCPWYLKPPVQVVPLQIYVHVLGDPLLSIVDNDFVHCGVRAGAEADQGCLRLGPGAVVAGGSRNGKMDPGVLAPGSFNSDEGPGVPYRGHAGQVFDLHCAAVYPGSKFVVWHPAHPMC